MFVNNLNPVLLSLGPFEIRYYGLFAVLGFVLAYFILKKTSKLSEERIENFLLYAGVGGILGARLFYVLVYNFQYYLANPSEIIAIWHGGLSAHGSFIGGLIGIYLFSLKYKYDVLELLDLVTIPTILGLALGRIGNFVNGELFGRITDIPWCVKFLAADGCRHPSQLYESLYSFVIFFILWKLKDKKMKKGTMLALSLFLYGLFRFVAEFFREPDVQLGFISGLTTGQWLSVLVVVIGAVLYYKINNNIKRN